MIAFILPPTGQARPLNPDLFRGRMEFEFPASGLLRAVKVIPKIKLTKQKRDSLHVAIRVTFKESTALSLNH